MRFLFNKIKKLNKLTIESKVFLVTFSYKFSNTNIVSYFNLAMAMFKNFYGF